MGVQHNTPSRHGGIAHLPAWISRPFYHAGYRYPFHDHSYCEIFWVESGEIRHTVGNQPEELLQPGDLRFVHPTTAHALGADRPSVLVNLAFPVEMLSELATFAGEWPFRAGEAPGFHLTPAGCMALQQWSEQLFDPKLDRLTVGAFLLWLLAEIRRAAEPVSEQGTPAWLQLALASYGHPAQLAQGVAGLVQLSERSSGHLSRAIRKRFDCTTAQLVNRRRLTWLASQLRTTDTPIPNLAAACGLSNLGNCYRQFGLAYGCPPGEYRRQAQITSAHTDIIPNPA